MNKTQNEWYVYTDGLIYCMVGKDDKGFKVKMLGQLNDIHVSSVDAFRPATIQDVLHAIHGIMIMAKQGLQNIL